MNKSIFSFFISSFFSYLYAGELITINNPTLKYILLALFTTIAVFIVYKGFRDLNKILKERKEESLKNKQKKELQTNLKNEIEKLQEQINKAVLEQDNRTAQSLLKELNNKKEKYNLFEKNK